MATNDTSKPKRRLKPAPQTVRQQAEKAQAADSVDKPVKQRRLRSAAKKTAKPLSPIGKLLKFLFYRQPFKFIGKVVGFIVVPPFVRGAFSELRQVTWPNARETRRLTIAVLIFAIIFAVVVGIVDYGFNKLFKLLILE